MNEKVQKLKDLGLNDNEIKLLTAPLRVVIDNEALPDCLRAADRYSQLRSQANEQWKKDNPDSVLTRGFGDFYE
jgi:hypothetical protein